MRVEVDTVGYESAAAALTGANHRAAIAHEGLRSRLSGFHALGGDDASSEDFVREYDAAAAEAVGALAALVAGLGSLAGTARASGRNHRQADRASTYGGVLDDDPGPGPGEEPVAVPAFTPPTSLGGDATGVPDWWSHVVDHLQGFGWPSADTGQLRSAASAWRSAAGAVEALADDVTEALDHLRLQRSPEIGSATVVLTTTRADVLALAEGMRGLGEACEDYATQVEATRETIRGLLRDLALECGLTAGLGLALGVVTLGGSAVVGGGVVTARAVSYARRVLAALRALKAARAVLAISRRTAELSRVRRAFEHLHTARRLATVKQVSRPGLRSTQRQLQSKFKHAEQFDVPGRFNRANAEKFDRALRDFLDHPTTVHREGTYRGLSVNLSFSPSTGQVVVSSRSGDFVSGWRMSYAQLEHVIRTGDLGGHP